MARNQNRGEVPRSAASEVHIPGIVLLGASYSPVPVRIQKSRSPNSGSQCSSGVGYRALRRIYVFDPPRGLGGRES